MSDTFSTLAAVDVSPLFDGTEVEVADTGAAMLAAMETSNGFVATGVPGAASLDARIGNLLRFFELPEPERLALATRRHRADAGHCYRGFFPLPEERGWAHNEIFDFGPNEPSRAPQGHPVKRFLEETNQWPAREPCAGWRSAAEALFDDLRALSVAVMAALAGALDEDVGAVMSKFDDGNGTLRILHYPPPPDGFVAAYRETLPERVDAAGRRIITHRHTDACVLSVLWQDGIGGLQYEGRDGTWREVPSGNGRLSIHAGRALALMTRDRIAGTPHRVVGTGLDRCSLGFFLEPGFAEVIARDEDERPFTYADHMKDDFADLDVYADVMGDAVAA
ncbi:MAG: hypothetical protein OXQ84_22110 [bacterium]|nr:hypothetical protein [bacterium]